MVEIIGTIKVIKMATTTTTKKGITVKDIEEGDIFSEQSHYIFDTKNGNKLAFTHLESGNKVNLTENYVANLLQTADQYDSEVEVGIEDKKWTAAQLIATGTGGTDDRRVGDVKQKGILSIWDDIHSQQVFTVNFNRANKELSNKALNEAKEKQLVDSLAAIAKAQKEKKGVAQVAADVIRKIQENPILPIEKGEERILRGYKTQFNSINGVYDVIDMDIKTGVPKRQVNVRAINWLVFNGVKYIVK